MAIFIASTKSISRGNGQSAVASASYRAGVELEDKRYGKSHDYSKRHGVMSANIILPSALADAKSTIDRGRLWNKAESAEKRKDARVAREWLVNLPHELSAEDRKALAHTFAQKLANRYGTIADCAIHQPTQKEIDRGADPRNHHAHILFTTRCAELDDNNEIILTGKASIELSDNKRRLLGMERVSYEIKEVRQIWEHIANEKLAEHNHELIDSRSYAEQGIDIEPQLKMGSVATKLERDNYERELRKVEKAKEEGEHYDIDKTPVTQLGSINEIINQRNELVWGVALAKNQMVNDAANQIIFNKREDNERQASDISAGIAWSTKRCENLPKRTDDTKQRINGTIQANNELTKRIDDTKRAIEGITEAIGKSDIEINRAAERSTRPAPTPFDDNYRRAFHERERRINRELREHDRQLHKESCADEQDNNDLRTTLSVCAHHLITRHNEKFSLRPGFRDNPADYPEKFDYRQVKILDRFANRLGLTNDFYDFREEQRRVADLFTLDVMQDNLSAMDILINRQKERKNYNEVTAGFDEFITILDANRAAKNKELQGSLGRSDISCIIAETLTAVSYLDHIEQYISKETTSDKCKALAQEQIKETLTRTSKQYQFSFERLRKLDSNEIAQKHDRTLKSSLGRFSAKYADKLADSDIKSINQYLKVISQEVEITRPINRRLS